MDDMEDIQNLLKETRTGIDTYTETIKDILMHLNLLYKNYPEIYKELQLSGSLPEFDDVQSMTHSIETLGEKIDQLVSDKNYVRSLMETEDINIDFNLD